MMPPTTPAQLEARNGQVPPSTMTPEETINRQRAEIDKLFDEAQNDEQRRGVLYTELASNRARRMELEALIEKENGDRTSEIQQLREINEANAVLTRKLYEQLEQGIAERQVGGKNAGVRNFDSLRDAAEFAVRAMIGSGQCGDIISNEASPAHTLASDIKQRDLTGAAGFGDTFAPMTPARAVIGLVDKFTPALEECGTQPMTEAKMPLLNRGQRVKGYRVGRATSVTSSDLGDLTKSQEDAQEYGALTFVHKALLADADTLPSLGDLIIEDMADAISQLLELDVTLGVKAAADTNLGYDPGAFWFNGFLNDAGVATATMGAGDVTFAAATFKDYLTLVSSLPEKVPSDNLKFHLHRSHIFNLMGQQDTQGRFIWQPPTDVSPGTIWGWPYRTWKSLPSTAASVQLAKPFVVFGDLKRAYAIGVRQTFTFEQSEHFRFPERLVAMLGIARFAAKVADAEAIVALKTAAA